MYDRIRVGGAVCFLGLFALFPLNSMAGEVKVYAIGDFVPNNSGGCGGSDVNHWPDMVDEWYDEMGRQGHSKDGQFTNGAMTIQRFCDPDWNSGCIDDEHVDDGDAVMIATHGSDSGDHWQGTMRSRWNSECGLDAGGSGNNMNVGDIDLEFIHLSSCYSADDDNLSGIRNALTDPVDGGYAHQWHGFHGIMWIGNGFDNDYEDFADDAHSFSMADAWVENHFRNNVDCEWYDAFDFYGTCEDQCPISYVISNTESNVQSRRDWERYNNVYSDPRGNNWWNYTHISGCNPVGETAFNP